MAKDDFHKQDTLPEGIVKVVKNYFPQLTEIPQKIGPYKIENLIEKGGMSILYLGVHPDTKEPTTIKVLLPKFLSHPDVVQRFLTEAEIIAMTDHPNIVKLYGHGEWDGGLYIAMEYIQGVSLRQKLLQSPISLKKALEIIIDIAYALCHLHTHGVIHRDLKPENILITDSSEVKVIDFGIAQLLTEKGTRELGESQRLIGTPVYMSPEQHNNPESVSYPSDIYSLGIIFYELVLGKLSHGKIHLTLMPKGLQKILTKTLQPNPQDRYHDIVDFITDVSAYLNSTNLDKEKKAGDQLSEISDNLRNVQEILVPKGSPNWPGIEVGHNSLKGLNIFGIYYDFFTYDDGSFGVVVVESTAKGALGIIYTAMVKGMIQTLIKQTHKPMELVKMLNELLINDHIEELFTFSYVSLQPAENTITCISCGYGNLWKISGQDKRISQIKNRNVGLGIDRTAEFNETITSWNIGDYLIIGPFGTDTEDENQMAFFENLAQENTPTHNLQKNIDAILRKAQLSLSKTSIHRSLTLIGLVHH
ncbi:MAG TPA: protein kinase [Parachlamydiaceae bacterium]|nr:protein kinase [Parachlamydiaceae bacterium]